MKRPTVKKNPSFSPKNYLIAFLLIIIVIFIGLFIYARTISPIAIVNGKRITRVSFNNELQKQAGNKVLDTMITRMLIYEEAKKRKISISDAAIQNEINKIETDLKAQKKTLDKMLLAENITREDLYERIKLNLTTQKIIEKYTLVTDKEIDAFIEKNPEVFQGRVVKKEIRADIKERLRQQKIAKQINILINNLKKNSHTEVYFK